MRKYILIGVAAFAVVAVVRMPASVVRLATERVDGLALPTVAGTVWAGRAHLVYRAQSIGDLAWTVRPGRLLAGEVRASWQLADPASNLGGIAVAAWSGVRLTASGRIGAATLNRLLGRYDIRIGGDLAVEDAALNASRGGARLIAGNVAWSGGRTFYRLAGQSYDTVLPPMVATVATTEREGEHTLDAALADDAQASLIEARLGPDGWIAISLTRRFVALAGKPWPTPGDDDAVVLTVEERLLR